MHVYAHTHIRTHTRCNHKGTWKEGEGITAFHEKCVTKSEHVEVLNRANFFPHKWRITQ